MNARNEVIPIQHCLDNLAPLEMLPSNHLMLQQCPTLMCKYPNGERLRFHWSMRNGPSGFQQQRGGGGDVEAKNAGHRTMDR